MENLPVSQQGQSAAPDSSSRRTIWILVGVGAVVVCLCLALAIVGGVIFLLLPARSVVSPAPNLILTPAASQATAQCQAVQTLPDEGRNHLASPVETPVWQSDPPTSGTHNPVWQTAGVYETPQDLTKIVHSLEHGYIVIYWRDLKADEVSALVARVRNDLYKIIINPYPQAPARVVLTAWAHMQKCVGVDEPAIRGFISRFRDQGPEKGAQ